MEGVLLLDAARAAHIMGLAAGLGLAFCADILAVRALFVPVSGRDVWLLGVLHRVILGGLALLWLSGLYILYLRTGFDPAQFTPKLMAKLAVVTLLSLNAASISRVALPAFASQQGRTFGTFPAALRLRLSAIAGLSLSCWLSGLALGVFSQFKPMGFDGLTAILAPVFAAGLGGAMLFAMAAGLILRDRPETGRLAGMAQRA